MDSIRQSLPATEARLQQLAEKQKDDPVCSAVRQYCQTKWPDRVHLPPVIGPYWYARQYLSVAGDLLLKGQRIVIPGSLRDDMLDILHQGHQGIGKCRARARQSVWWPGLSTEIKSKVGNCPICIKHRTTQRDPYT